LMYHSSRGIYRLHCRICGGFYYSVQANTR